MIVNGAANDGNANGSAPSFDGVRKASPDRPYYFEICQTRPQNAMAKLENFEHWVWRLISPVGTALLECGGYSDEESSRAVVALLQEKAGNAEVSVSGS